MNAQVNTQALVAGAFITANLVGQQESRQGLFIRKIEDGSLLVAAESGATYLCEPDAQVVPDSNLYGSTKKFVDHFRGRMAQMSQVAKFAN